MSDSMKTIRKRRVRRREKARITNAKSVPAHKLIGGRTGSFWKRQEHSKKVYVFRTIRTMENGKFGDAQTI